MNALPNPEQAQFSKGSLPVKSLVERLTFDPADPEAINDGFRGGRPSLRNRVPLALARFLITFCIGVAATVAWQSYGDAARERIGISFPQLGWSAPQAARVVPVTPDVIAPAAPAAPSLDQQQLSAISLDLDAVRQSVDRIAAGQEQMTRSVDQLADGQEQTAREITKLQAIGQYILYKNSEPPPPQPSPQVSTPRQSQPRTPR